MYNNIIHDVVGFQDNHRSYILGGEEWTLPIPYELDADLGEKWDFMDTYGKYIYILYILQVVDIPVSFSHSLNMTA